MNLELRGEKNGGNHKLVKQTGSKNHQGRMGGMKKVSKAEKKREGLKVQKGEN